MRSGLCFAAGFAFAAVVTVLVDRLLNPEPRVEPQIVVPAPFYSWKTEARS